MKLPHASLVPIYLPVNARPTAPTSTYQQHHLDLVLEIITRLLIAQLPALPAERNSDRVALLAIHLTAFLAIFPKTVCFWPGIQATVFTLCAVSRIAISAPPTCLALSAALVST